MESLMNLLIPSAYAESVGTAPSPQGSSLSFLFMMVIIFLFFYIAIWRPQNKRAKEQRNLLTSLAKGDEVVTAGGLVGRITKISDQYLTLTVSNNTDIILQKASVVTVLPKGTIKTLE